jgi:hypothetical protein
LLRYKEVERFWKKNREKIWLPLEIALMLTALAAPFLFSPQFRLKKSMLSSTLFRVEFLAGADELEGRKIASSTLALPEPESLHPGKALDWQIGDRQIRFEYHSTEWKFSALSRQDFAKNWERVGLIFDADRQLSFSPYLELEEGENHFQIEYRSRGGKKMLHPLVISYSRKRKT